MSNHPKTILVALAILIRKNIRGRWEVLLQQRIEQGPLNGKLEFPGGKINPGENPENASKREIFEEMGYDIENFKLFKIYNFSYSDRRVQLYACVSEYATEKANTIQKSVSWFELDENGSSPSNLIEGSQAIWSDLIQYFARGGNIG